MIKTSLLMTKSCFELHLFDGKDSPEIIEEIGKARVKAFGSYLGNTATSDTDRYDSYYQHLFLRHTETSDIVGAYRLGVGHEIYASFGKEGFYLNELFEFNESNEHLLAQSMELGRSFILPAYQQKFLPLLMLWQGIYKIFLNDDKLKSIIGPVSLPSKEDNTFRDAVLNYLKAFHPHPKFWISGKNNIKLNATSDFTSLDDIESHFADFNEKVPVLIRKYLDQNATILGYNQDNDFGGSIDILSIMSKDEMPLEKHGFLKK